MKPLKGKLWAKILAYILFVACAVGLVAGATVTAVMFDQNYFVDNGTAHYNAKQENAAQHRGNMIAYEHFAYACEEFLRHPTRELDALLSDYLAEYRDPAYSNLCFTLTDIDSGTVLAQSYTAEHRTAEVTETTDMHIDPGPLETRQIDALLALESGVSPLQDWLLTLVREDLAAIRDNGAEDATLVVPVTVAVTTSVNTDFPARDGFYWNHWLHGVFSSLRGSILYLLPLLITGCIFFFCFLMAAAGHRATAESIVLSPIDRIPLDLYLAIVAGLFGLLLAVLDTVYYSWSEYLMYGLLATATILLLPAVGMTIATRIKTRQLLKNTLIYKLLRLCKRYWRKIWRGVLYLCRRLPLFWKALLAFAGISLIEFLFIINISYDPWDTIMFWLLEKLAITPLLIFVVLNLQTLKKGAKALAEGNLQHKIDTRYMFWEFKNHAGQLNNISDGMQKAVEAQLKNERLKTELITNVSHDIKTPLTSIINYVDLLKKEELGNETAAGYLEILDRQSARLKKLTEDLVEASKADTGNIPVHLEKTDVSVLLEQVTGEYEEKLAAKNLQIVPDIRSHAQILADGRLLQRIFENLLGNVCKYAMENTRVYLTCEDDGNEVQIAFKNISKYPLNITSDELTERFVRGDGSRNTEGSGLGLSIAKSLARLQNAQLYLYIDGDLFKAMIRFKIEK